MIFGSGFSDFCEEMTHDRPSASTEIALDPWDSKEMSDQEVRFPILPFPAIRIPVWNEGWKDF